MAGNGARHYCSEGLAQFYFQSDTTGEISLVSGLPHMPPQSSPGWTLIDEDTALPLLAARQKAAT